MSKAAAAPAPAEGAEGAPKKSKKMLFIIIGVVALLLVGGGAVFLMKSSHGDEHADEDAEMQDEESAHHDKAAEKEKLKKKKKAAEAGHPPIFVALDPFTVNLQPETQTDQYLQVAATLKMEDQPSADSIKNYMPEIRHRSLLLLSGKKASEIASPEGREKLAEELKDAFNAILGEVPKSKKGEPVTPIGPVEDVLFTSFIVQ